MSSDFKDSVLSFQQKLLSLEEEVEMKCSESNNRRNEIDSIDKNIQTLSNHGNLCNRKSEIEVENVKKHCIQLEDNAMRASKDVRITQETDAAFVESYGIEHSLLREEVRKLRTEKNGLLKHFEMLKSKKSDSGDTGLNDLDSEPGVLIESFIAKHNQCLENEAKLQEEVLQVETVASEYQMKLWNSIRRLKQLISRCSDLESVLHSENMVQMEMEEIEMTDGFEDVDSGDDISMFFTNEQISEEDDTRNFTQDKIDTINLEINAKSDQIKLQLENMDRMLQGEKEAMDTKKQKKKMIDELEEKLRQAREETPPPPV